MSGPSTTRIGSRRVARWAVFLGYDLGAGTPDRASRRCTSVKKEILICGPCWCRGRTTSWDPLEKTVICGDGDCALPSAEGKMPRNERLLRWPESWRYYCIGCG